MNAAAASSAPVPATRWTRPLISLAMGGIAVVLVIGLGSRLFGQGLPLNWVLAAFLICFAVLKFSIGTDAVLRLRSVAATPDPRATHGGSGMVWGWVAYKYLAAAIALAVAIYVLTSGAERINALFLR